MTPGWDVLFPAVPVSTAARRGISAPAEGKPKTSTAAATAGQTSSAAPNVPAIVSDRGGGTGVGSGGGGGGSGKIADTDQPPTTNSGASTHEKNTVVPLLGGQKQEQGPSDARNVRNSTGGESVSCQTASLSVGQIQPLAPGVSSSAPGGFHGDGNGAHCGTSTEARYEEMLPNISCSKDSHKSVDGGEERRAELGKRSSRPAMGSWRGWTAVVFYLAASVPMTLTLDYLLWQWWRYTHLAD